MEREYVANAGLPTAKEKLDRNEQRSPYLEKFSPDQIAPWRSRLIWQLRCQSEPRQEVICESSREGLEVK